MEKLKLLMGRAGRGEHGDCGGLEVGAVKAPAVTAVRLVIDGAAAKGRTRVVVNDAACDLQDALFTYVLRLTVGALKSRDVWWEREQLGIGRARKVVSRARLALKPFEPAGFEIVETDRRGGTRINPAVEIGAILWDRLLVHPSDAIRKVAQECSKKRA